MIGVSQLPPRLHFGLTLAVAIDSPPSLEMAFEVRICSSTLCQIISMQSR